MLILTHKNYKLIKNFLGGHAQKWMWPVRSRDSKIDCVSKIEQMEQTDLLHAGTNSGKLKVETVICGWVWSEIAEIFQFMRPKNLL